MNQNKTDTIRLGLLAPLTGLVSMYGPEIARAGQIATDLLKKLNHAGQPEGHYAPVITS